MPAGEILERIDAAYPLVPAMAEHAPGAPRTSVPMAMNPIGSGTAPPRRAAVRNQPTGTATWTGPGIVGVVASVTRPFCSNCDRVQADGRGVAAQLLVRRT